MLLSHSLLLPKEIFSTRAKGTGKLSLIIGSKHFFDNSQTYLSRDAKHRDGRCLCHSAVLNFIFQGRFMVAIACQLVSQFLSVLPILLLGTGSI